MARLWHSGAELGHEHAEGLTLTGTTMTFDTGTKRSGARAFKFDTSAGVNLAFDFTGATARTYYACAHILFPAATGLPGTDADVMRMTTAADAWLTSLRVTAAGKVQVWSGVGTQVGSDSAATMVADTWYRLELVTRVNASSNDDTIEGYLDGVLIASTTIATIGTTAPGRLKFGWVLDPGTSEVIFFDDIALNDGVGSANNGLVGNQKVYALFPTADSARLVWTGGGGGTSGLFGGVDNIPPAGVNPTTAGDNQSIKQNASTIPNNYDATMTTYTAAGVISTDVVSAVMPVIEASSDSTTGSDTVTFSGVSNPVIAGVAGSCDANAAGYPSSWIRTQGTMAENPTVTNGTAPVMRVVKDVATTRKSTVCLMTMVVSVNPLYNIAVPVATASGAGLTPSIGLAPPLGTASGAGLAPTPQATAAVPVGAAAAVGKSVTLALTAPSGAATGAGLVPTAALATPVGAASGAGLTPTAALSAPKGAATGAGLAPIPQANAVIPKGAASGAGLTPALAALLTTADASGAGQTPSLGLGIATGAIAGAGLDPTPRVNILLPVGIATGLGLDVTLDVGDGTVTIDVPLATATGAGLVVTPTVAIPLSVAVGSGAGYAPGIDLLLAVATAEGLGYAPAPIIAIPLGVGAAMGAGLTPTPRVNIPLDLADILGVGYDVEISTEPQPLVIIVPVGIATGQGHAPLVLVVVPVDLATATGEGYALARLALLIPTGHGYGSGLVFFPLPGLALIGRIRDVLTGRSGSGALIGNPRRTIASRTTDADLIGSTRRTLIGRRP